MPSVTSTAGYTDRLRRWLSQYVDPETQSAYWLLTPILVFFAVFQYYPILKSIVISFTQYGLLLPETPFVGVQNYVSQFQDPLFLSALGNTLIFVGAAVGVGVTLALTLAVFVERTGRWAKVYRTLYFVPVVTSLMATSMVWRWLYSPDGLINYLLTSVGLEAQPWLLSESLALPALIVLTIWKNLGFDLVLFSAALQSIPKTYYEASSLEGASAWQDFWYITLPQLRPILLLVSVTAVIRSFRVFTIILAMTQGGPINATRTIVYHIYEQGIQYDEMGYASAAAVILLIIVGLATYAQLRVNRNA